MASQKESALSGERRHKGVCGCHSHDDAMDSQPDPGIPLFDFIHFPLVNPRSFTHVDHRFSEIELIAGARGATALTFCISFVSHSSLALGTRQGNTGPSFVPGISQNGAFPDAVLAHVDSGDFPVVPFSSDGQKNPPEESRHTSPWDWRIWRSSLILFLVPLLSTQKFVSQLNWASRRELFCLGVA